jgi:hypothetical protein
VLAAILAHLHHLDLLRSALTVLRNIVADDNSAMHFAGQGAYHIVFAVLQTHCSQENMDLVKLASSILWRMHQSKSPMTSWQDFPADDYVSEARRSRLESAHAGRRLLLHLLDMCPTHQ